MVEQQNKGLQEISAGGRYTKQKPKLKRLDPKEMSTRFRRYAQWYRELAKNIQNELRSIELENLTIAKRLYGQWEMAEFTAQLMEGEASNDILHLSEITETSLSDHVMPAIRALVRNANILAQTVPPVDKATARKLTQEKKLNEQGHYK